MPVAVVATAAVAWFALVVLAPVLPAPLAAVVYAAGGFVCHQLPDRSFHWHGAQLAVCARCTGIYLGACSAAIVAPLPATAFSAWVDSRARVGWLLGAAAVPTIATVAAEWIGLWQPSAITRAVTGVLLGVAGAFVLMPALKARPGDPGTSEAKPHETGRRLAGLKYSECLPRAVDEPRRPPKRQPPTRR